MDSDGEGLSETVKMKKSSIFQKEFKVENLSGQRYTAAAGLYEYQ